jgi:hypothetical protein
VKRLIVLLSVITILASTASFVSAYRVFDGSQADREYLQRQIDRQNEEARYWEQRRQMQELQRSIDTMNKD